MIIKSLSASGFDAGAWSGYADVVVFVFVVADASVSPVVGVGAEFGAEAVVVENGDGEGIKMDGGIRGTGGISVSALALA